MLLILPLIILCIAMGLYYYDKNKYHAICWEAACFSNILLSNIVFFGALLYVMFIIFPSLAFANQLLAITVFACTLSCALTLTSILCNYKDIKEDISEYLCYGNESDYAGSCLSRIMQEMNFSIPTLLFSVILSAVGKIIVAMNK